MGLTDELRREERAGAVGEDGHLVADEDRCRSPPGEDADSCG